MFTRILRHEWRLLAGEGVLWLVAGVFTVATAYATFTGARWVRFEQRAIAEAVAEERDRHAAQEATIAALRAGTRKVSAFADPRNPQAASTRFGPRYAVMPPAPLAALSIGQSDLLPSYYKVTADAKETVTAAAEIENPHRLLTGRFDLAFVIIYLYPLLILALSYNMLSGEKEHGTLAMILSQPVSLRVLVLGKIVLRAGVLFGVIACLGSAALWLAGAPLATGAVAAHAGLWLASVVVYGLVWFTLAALVSAFGRPSATNAMVLAAAWLAGVILVPSLLNMLATTLYPVPSRVQMIQAVREASDEASEQGSVLLARYYEDHPDLAAGGAEQAMNDFNVIRVAVNAEVEARVRPVMARYEAQLERQRTLLARARLLSPAILMQDALNDLSGTGTARHARFLQQVLAYHERWRAHFVPLIFRKAQVERYDTLPTFVFRDEAAAAEVAGRVGASLGLMLLPVAGLGAIGWRRLRRFPVA